MQRGLIAEIDLKSLSNNLKVVKGLSKGAEIIAVVKADAYGHGAVEVSKRLIKEGISYLAVAFSSEAVQLREAGITCRIITLFDIDFDSVIGYNIIPTISNIKQAKGLSSLASKRGININVHLKIDTGMGRTGFILENNESDILNCFSLKGLVVEGILSHFSEADLKDKEFAYYQINKLNNLKSYLSQKGIEPKYWHISNSSALMSIPEANLDAVRPGLMLYGYSTLEDNNTSYKLKPVMSVKTKILQIRKVKANSPISYGRTFVTKRDSNIAVIAVGYADGLNRLFSNNLDVIIGGKLAPVIGSVCMDLTMVDITEIDNVTEKSEVIIMGRQGKEEIWADELANRIGTIPYEILTTFGMRAKRNYRD